MRLHRCSSEALVCILGKLEVLLQHALVFGLIDLIAVAEQVQTETSGGLRGTRPMPRPTDYPLVAG